ncbi:cardiolipin synthase [Sinosporangium album]|uniref:Cardiolipin synthase n=1 Tax=Sinosporangium album TaxID=504805 RepID=A0A1G7WLU5_9ACTN|nr:CDP-alcohol phosphatidyltransferase family protein [Sinosporangium album]SDG72951.1 cardiolipin synthase [Sinosporangium album]
MESAEDRIWTVPNALSFLRLLGVPVFLWLVLGPEADGWAIALLMLAGFSDWLDGKLARAWNQTSRLGRLIDPLADRLYILATLVGLVLREAIPWWLAVLVVARDVVMVPLLLVLKEYGYGPLPVHFLGKAATANLMYAFPLLFLASHVGWYSEPAAIFGWAFAIWGTGLYWWAGVLYAVQARVLIRDARAERERPREQDSERR